MRVGRGQGNGGCRTRIPEAPDWPGRCRDWESWWGRITSDKGRRFVVIPQRLVEGRNVVQLGLDAVQGGHRRLRVEIDGQNAMPPERKELCQMRGSRRLARSPLEVDDRHDMQLFAVAPVRHVEPFAGAAMRVEIFPDFEDLLGGIAAAPGRSGHRLGAFSFEVQFLDRGLGHADELGHLGHREQPQVLLGVRRVLLLAQHIETIRNQFALIQNDLVEVLTRQFIGKQVIVHLPAS